MSCGCKKDIKEKKYYTSSYTTPIPKVNGVADIITYQEPIKQETNTNINTSAKPIVYGLLFLLFAFVCYKVIKK